MVGWHYRLKGCEFEQTLGHSEGQGRLVYCSPWGSKESDMTELNWQIIFSCKIIDFFLALDKCSNLQSNLQKLNISKHRLL